MSVQYKLKRVHGIPVIFVYIYRGAEEVAKSSFNYEPLARQWAQRQLWKLAMKGVK